MRSHRVLRMGQPDVFLIPIDISFEKVGDNWEVEDNKDKDGNWMPGKGKRMFVDAKTQQETAMRDTVYVKVKSLPPGWKIRLKALDVDDPTTDELDPQHVIDSNDTASIKRGNDNRGYDNLGIQQPPYFESSGDVTEDCTVDAQGVAKLANGELPKLQMTDHAGDNVRVAVIFLKPDGTPMEGQDLSVLQVNDSTQPGYVPGDSEQQASGFSGGLSPMLTVWRKLNVEVDSMQAVATSGDQKNYEEGVVQVVASGPSSGETTVTIDILLDGPADRYENGYLTVGGTSYKVVSNTDDLTNFTTGDRVVVKGTVPSSAVSQSFTIVDDDDHFLAQLGLGDPLPRHQTHADTIAAMRARFAPAYIQLEDANELGFNPNQTITFGLNEEVDSALGSVFNNAKDLSDSEKFWAITLVFGYQPQTSADHDPLSEGLLKGGTSKFNLGNSSFGFSVVYIESIRESTLDFIEGVSGIFFNNPALMQQAVDEYYNQLYGTAAHEIGHNPGGQSEQQDHDEEGLMQEGGAGIDVPFSPSTIKRFRDANQWTH